MSGETTAGDSDPVRFELELGAGTTGMNVLCMTKTYAFAGNEVLTAMSKAAAKATKRALSAEGDRKKKLLDLALKLREQEMDGWLRVRSEEYPAGDALGASMAAMGVANIYLIRQDLQRAENWYSRADELCPADDAQQRANIQHNRKQIQNIRARAL